MGLRAPSDLPQTAFISAPYYPALVPGMPRVEARRYRLDPGWPGLRPARSSSRPDSSSPRTDRWRFPDAENDLLLTQRLITQAWFETYAASSESQMFAVGSCLNYIEPGLCSATRSVGSSRPMKDSTGSAGYAARGVSRAPTATTLGNSRSAPTFAPGTDSARRSASSHLLDSSFGVQGGRRHARSHLSGENERCPPLAGSY